MSVAEPRRSLSGHVPGGRRADLLLAGTGAHNRRGKKTLKRVDVGDQAELHCTEARLLVEAPCRSIVGSHSTRYEDRSAHPECGEYRANELPRNAAAARIGPNVELS